MAHFVRQTAGFGNKMLWLFVAMALFAGLWAGNADAQATNGRFATIHVVNTAQKPKVEPDWIGRLADSHSADAGHVWVIDLSTRRILVEPADIAGAAAGGLRGALQAALQKAVATLQVPPAQGAMGSVVDAAAAREALVKVMGYAHRTFERKAGRGSDDTVAVDVVIWADRVFVGDAIDLSERYLPATCFVRLGEKGKNLFISFPGQDNFVTRLVLRSLDPDRAAASREAQTITLPALFRSRKAGDARAEVSGPVVEAASDCPRPEPAAGAAGVTEAVPAAADCAVALPAPPVRPDCGITDVGAQFAQNTVAPPATANGSGTSTAAGTPVAAPPVVPPVAPPTVPEPPQPVPPDTPPEAPPETQPVAPPPEAPPTPAPDQSTDVGPMRPAQADGYAGSPGLLSLVTGTVARFEREPGLALSLRSSVEGSALLVRRNDGNPSPLSGQSVELPAGRGGEATVTRPDADAERAVFDVFLQISAAALCRVRSGRIEAIVALPLSEGLRVRREFQISLAAGRCQDTAEIQTLFLGKVEVP